jgi:hypothetical protein
VSFAKKNPAKKHALLIVPRLILLWLRSVDYLRTLAVRRLLLWEAIPLAVFVGTFAPTFIV